MTLLLSVALFIKSQLLGSCFVVVVVAVAVVVVVVIVIDTVAVAVVVAVVVLLWLLMGSTVAEVKVVDLN